MEKIFEVRYTNFGEWYQKSNLTIFINVCSTVKELPGTVYMLATSQLKRYNTCILPIFLR